MLKLMVQLYAQTFSLLKLYFFFLLDKENVWRDVCNMGDEIPVNYDTIEQLFCQKEIAKSTTDGPMQKIIPTKVCFHVMPKKLIHRLIA